jgi:hypothetical protein
MDMAAAWAVESELQVDLTMAGWRLESQGDGTA